MEVSVDDLPKGARPMGLYVKPSLAPAADRRHIRLVVSAKSWYALNLDRLGRCLRGRQAHHGVTGTRPMKFPGLQNLTDQNDAAAIPHQKFDPIGAL